MFKRKYNGVFLRDEVQHMLPPPPADPWKTRLFDQALQRVPLLDARFPKNTHWLARALKQAGQPNYGSPLFPLPNISRCGPRYKASVGVLGPTGKAVFGETWIRLKREGYLAESRGAALLRP